MKRVITKESHLAPASAIKNNGVKYSPWQGAGGITKTIVKIILLIHCSSVYAYKFQPSLKHVKNGLVVSFINHSGERQFALGTWDFHCEESSTDKFMKGATKGTKRVATGGATPDGEITENFCLKLVNNAALTCKNIRIFKDGKSHQSLNFKNRGDCLSREYTHTQRSFQYTSSHFPASHGFFHNENDSGEAIYYDQQQQELSAGHMSLFTACLQFYLHLFSDRFPSRYEHDKSRQFLPPSSCKLQAFHLWGAQGETQIQPHGLVSESGSTPYTIHDPIFPEHSISGITIEHGIVPEEQGPYSSMSFISLVSPSGDSQPAPYPVDLDLNTLAPINPLPDNSAVALIQTNAQNQNEIVSLFFTYNGATTSIITAPFLLALLLKAGGNRAGGSK